MSIATNITGGNASSQLLDLLAVVANPDVYKAKIDALDAATAENKKYVEALGPASEIVALRDQAKALTQEAMDALAKSRADAAQIVSAANAKADGIVIAAQNTADTLVAAAVVSKNEADQTASLNKAALAEAKSMTAAAETAKAIAEVKAVELAQAIADANAAKADAEATKASIIAKQEAFIKGL
jgi:cell division septum initiation protein DivIVA